MRYILFGSILILLLSGCAYSVYSNSLPHLKTIAVSSFENKSNEFELETELQDFLVRRFDEDGRLRVVTLAPDCILEGSILDYTKKMETYDETGVEEYAVRILFRLKFTDLKKNEVIWEKDSLILSEVFSENSETREFTSETESRDSIYDKLFLEFMKNTLEQW